MTRTAVKKGHVDMRITVRAGTSSLLAAAGAIAVAVACSSGSDGTGAVAACDALAQCCSSSAQPDQSAVSDCVNTVANQVASACAAALGADISAGYCAASASAGGGTATTGGSRHTGSSATTIGSERTRSSATASSSGGAAYQSCIDGTGYITGSSPTCRSCVEAHCASKFVAACGSDWASSCSGGNDGPYWRCVCSCPDQTATSPCVEGCSQPAQGPGTAAMQCAEQSCGSGAGC